MPSFHIVAMIGLAAGGAKWVTTYTSTGPVLAGCILFATQFLLYQACAIVLYARFLSPIRHLPEAPGPHLLSMRDQAGMATSNWAEAVGNNGLVRYSTWFQERVLITTPAALSEVLVTRAYEFTKPPNFRDGVGRILGIGLFLAEGDEHKMQRRSLAPSFAFRHVKDLYPVFWQKSRELVDAMFEASESGATELHFWDKENVDRANVAQLHRRGAIEVGAWSTRAALDIICITGMGQDFDSLHDPHNKLYHAYQDVFNPDKTAQVLMVLNALGVPIALLRHLPFAQTKAVGSAMTYIKQLLRDNIARKRKVFEDGGRAGEVDILTMAVETGNFSDEDLLAQMMTFLLAGHETTATALVWAVYLLCKHPDVQDRLRREVRSRIPSLEHDVTAADIDGCHYLQAVMSEVLRLWPPINLALRYAAHDTTVQGEHIPKGTTVAISPIPINRSTKLWGADALEFVPERWLNEDGTANQRGGAESNFAFLSFIHGPRSCIGQRFAQGEFGCLLAAWVGRFNTSLEKGSPLETGEPAVKGGVVTKPKGGLWCTLERLPDW